jgi:hypothetical protein
MLSAQATLPEHDTMLRHHIAHPATKFILPKVQPIPKDSTQFVFVTFGFLV